MKKILTIVVVLSFVSCRPYTQIFLSQESRTTFLEDSCDVYMISQLKYALDSIDYLTLQNPTMLLNSIEMGSPCDYYSRKMFHPQQGDTTIWLLTIRPFNTRNEEIILGNLYTLYPNQDSVLVLERRVKEYSQTKEFERGDYMILTYYIENDTTTRIHLGKRRL